MNEKLVRHSLHLLNDAEAVLYLPRRLERADAERMARMLLSLVEDAGHGGFDV